MVSAATAAPTSASISTPVWAVVSADAVISTASSSTERETSTCDSGSGWHSGISSLVRLAAMIPASCAAARASPFGSSRSRLAVAGVMRRLARATARLGLGLDVERVDRKRPCPELFVGARVLREDEDAVPLVHERRLLRDEIEPVEDRVHEKRVVLLVGGDGLSEVVLDAEVDRRPPVALEAVVHGARGTLDRPKVLGVFRDLLPRGVEERQHRDPAVHLSMRLEVELEGAEAAAHVLRRIRSVDAEDEELGPPPRDLPLEREHVRALRELLELARLDGDRSRRDEGAPAVVGRDALVEVALGSREITS